MSSTRQRLLNLPEVAEMLNRSVWAVRELIWKGKIPVVRLDRKVQVDINDLDKVIEENKRQNAKL